MTAGVQTTGFIQKQVKEIGDWLDSAKGTKCHNCQKELDGRSVWHQPMPESSGNMAGNRFCNADCFNQFASSG